MAGAAAVLLEESLAALCVAIGVWVQRRIAASRGECRQQHRERARAVSLPLLRLVFQSAVSDDVRGDQTAGYVTDIEKATLDEEVYRRVLLTGRTCNSS